MQRTDDGIRVGGLWLAIASVLMIAVLALHGPIAPDLTDQMTRIAGASLKWEVAHWIAAAALSFYAVTGLIVLTSDSRLTQSGWTLSAWAVLTIGALWTVGTAVVETTVVTDAAVSGNSAVFEAWWAYAEGMATGFTVLAIAVAAIAANEARDPERATPAWSAQVAMVAGIASFAGWALGMWLGVAIGNLLWLISSLLMSAWLVWLGVGLARSPVNEASEIPAGW